MKNVANIFVYIEFSSDKLPRETIERLWGDADMFFSSKGELTFTFESGKKVESIRQKDYCNVRYELIQSEKEINDIALEVLNNQKDNISYISKMCTDIVKRIHLCIYPDSEQFTFDFSSELLKTLVELNMEIGTTVLHL